MPAFGQVTNCNVHGNVITDAAGGQNSHFTVNSHSNGGNTTSYMAVNSHNKYSLTDVNSSNYYSGSGTFGNNTVSDTIHRHSSASPLPRGRVLQLNPPYPLSQPRAGVSSWEGAYSGESNYQSLADWCASARSGYSSPYQYNVCSPTPSLASSEGNGHYHPQQAAPMRDNNPFRRLVNLPSSSVATYAPSTPRSDTVVSSLCTPTSPTLSVDSVDHNVQTAQAMAGSTAKHYHLVFSD